MPETVLKAQRVTGKHHYVSWSAQTGVLSVVHTYVGHTLETAEVVADVEGLPLVITSGHCATGEAVPEDVVQAAKEAFKNLAG